MAWHLRGLDAFGRKHHAAVVTGMPRYGAFNGEIHLHPCDIKRPRLEDAPVSHQVGVDDLTTAERLQGDRNGTFEFDVVSLADSRRPGYCNISRVRTGCTADGRNKWRETTQTCCFHMAGDPYQSPGSGWCWLLSQLPQKVDNYFWSKRSCNFHCHEDQVWRWRRCHFHLPSAAFYPSHGRLCIDKYNFCSR